MLRRIRLFRFHYMLILLTLLVLLNSNSVLAAPLNPPSITSVRINVPRARQIVISGRYFGTTKPVVRLADISLTVEDGYTNVRIVAHLPARIPSPGDFQLTVTNSTTNLLGSFILTIGAIGPQGPQGPQGVQGLQGPQGTTGSPGEKGDKGDKGEEGEEGEKGDSGQSVTSEPIHLGDPRCPDGVGGTQYTDSTGVSIVCNGVKGDDGGEGATGARGPSDAFADGPNAFTLDSDQTPVASLSLPAGKFLVSASLTIENKGTSKGSPHCVVSDVVAFFVIELDPGNSLANLHSGTLSFTVPIELSSPGDIRLTCWNHIAKPNTVEAKYIFLTALQVGNLTSQ